MEEKRIPMGLKSRRQIIAENLDWMTNGKKCQWEHFVDQKSFELVLRRW